MKKEDLFESFGALDDDLLKRSEQGGKGKRNYSSKFLKYGSIAACLAVMLSVGMLFMDNKSRNAVPDAPNSSNIAESNDNVFDKQDHLQDKPESYVDVSMLLASNAGAEEQALKVEPVEIENYSAHYYKVPSVGSDMLRESVGYEVQGTRKKWYKVSGHEDKQYLIANDDNEYSLWKFESFQKESYPYSDVLQIIYDIHSAKDIAKIIVIPANMDNTDEGRTIQDEIGTDIVTDVKSIETIYNVLSVLTCYGGNHWDRIGLGDDAPSAMRSQVRAGRYLTIVTSQGMKIDTLKYTGISGMFYEYGGIAYNALNMEEKKEVEKILNIEMASEDNVPETGSTMKDVPVNEETYQDARAYSAELTDLQNRISEAMMNKELPFVISSAIYENPDRVYVRVNTTDKDLIAKLRAFDTVGKLLEIEYSTDTIQSK